MFPECWAWRCDHHTVPDLPFTVVCLTVHSLMSQSFSGQYLLRLMCQIPYFSLSSVFILRTGEEAEVRQSAKPPIWKRGTCLIEMRVLLSNLEARPEDEPEIPATVSVL